MRMVPVMRISGEGEESGRGGRQKVRCIFAPRIDTASGPPKRVLGQFQTANGLVTLTECADGTMFASNSSACIDAREVPECDIDECALWNNGETDSGNPD